MEKLMLAFAATGALALSACQDQGPPDLDEARGVDTTFRGYQETEPARETAPAPAQPSQPSETQAMPPTTEGMEEQASEAIGGSESEATGDAPAN